MISIKEEIAVPSPRSRVWKVISNPEDVVSCISGAELGAAHDDGTFDGALVVKFGAIRVKFAARISLELDEAEFEGRLTAKGGDGQGATRFRGEATFRVVQGEQADSSVVLMDGEVTLSGKLASLVESGAGVVVTRMTKDFTAKLIAKCGAPAEQQPAAAAIGAPAPAATAAAPTPAPASVSARPAPAPRTGWLSRCGAWIARVLLRRRPPQTQHRPASESASPSVPTPTSPNPTQTEEVGSGNAQAQ